MLSLLVLIASCAPKGPIPATPEPDAAVALIGRWRFVSVDGESGPETGDLFWTFEDGTLTEQEGGNSRSSPLALDTSVTPARMTLTNPPVIAIFEASARGLRVQLNDTSDEWPTDFSVQSPHMLIELEMIE